MNIKRAGTRLRVSFALAAVLALTIAVPASAGARDKAGMIDFTGAGAPVAGHISISRGAESVDVNVHLRDLNAGHAFTVWAVIWNDPGVCASSPCTENDLTKSGNAVIFSGMGGVANGGGNLNANSTITTSGIPTGPIPGDGLTNPSGAEIHFVVQDHGMASSVPAELLDQTTLFEGGTVDGCGDGFPPTTPEEECVDVQATIFQP
jgi:hypothetical protein